MNAKQRVKTAMSGGTPDRVPFIPQICHPHAIRVLGLPFEETCLDVVQNPKKMNRLTFEVCKMYGVDGMRCWPPDVPKEVVRVDDVWYGKDPETGRTLGRVDFAGGGGVCPPEEPSIHTDEDIDAIPVPTCDEILSGGRFEPVKEIIDEASDDMFIISCPGLFTVEHLTFERGKAQAMMDLVERPDFCHRALEKALAVALEQARALCSIGIDGLMIADTFAGVVGPEWFKEFCGPYWKRFVAAIHDEFGDDRPMIYLHICGKSTPLFELMADTGVDCIEPLDPLGGVEVRDAKERVGGRVALMGGVHNVKLAHGTLEEVRDDVERCLSEGAPGGGYILAAGDMLPTETSREKVELMMEMARQWGYDN